MVKIEIIMLNYINIVMVSVDGILLPRLSACMNIGKE